MKPFETLGEDKTPDGRRLTFHRRERDFFLYLDGEELMSTRRHRSESLLAEAALRELGSRPRPRILIGGLGLGFTLRSAVRDLPADGKVVVAELFEAVVGWNREHLRESAAVLADSRVEVRNRDVAEVIGASRGRYDAILLDVDNGPSAWCLDRNARLYSEDGLARIRSALTSSGVLAVWSAFPDPAFVRLLEGNGYEARSETVRARGEKGHRQIIFLAKVAGGRKPRSRRS